LIELAKQVLNRQTRGIARAITCIENDHPAREQLLSALHPHCGGAMIWGITGPPGSGKSSLVDQLISRQRAAGKKVAVIAIDPSSPFSGGAILGDRLRMQKHATDTGVFIRSMASRGHLGGVASATADTIRVLDAAGFDLILIETIGVGQTEIEIVEMADVVLLTLVPGLGDEIQALKAGIMEIGDIFVINKSDKEEALRVKTEVEYVLSLKYHDHPELRSPVVMTSVLLNSGIDELEQSAEAYFQKLKSGGQLEIRRRKRIASELTALLNAKLSVRIHQVLDLQNHIERWVEQVYLQKTSPYALINQQIEFIFREFKNS
jgi:LAO/AO transport system kinase